MVTSADLQKIARVEHPDPHAVLGPHARESALFIRVFRPDAVEVRILPDGAEAPRAASRIHPAGVFEAVFPGATAPFPYRVEARYEGGTFVFRDPYAFTPGLGELDEHLFAEGTHEQIYRHLGAHVREVDGVRGTAFAVWAPFAARVSVAGDFNGWDGRLHAMRRDKAGVWELFVPDVLAGALYKFEVRTPRGLVFMKADPFARAMELRPNNAAKVHERRFTFTDDAWLEARAQAAPHRRPMAIYEVHLGSWRRRHRPGEAQPDAGAAGWLTYRELAKELLDYVVEMGFTHVELLPVMEHPYDGSWGYQVAGYYAPTARWGDPDDLRYFIDQAHARGIGVLLDWVPAHFPKDAWALGRFDGTALFEHLDPRQGEHAHWNTFIFNYGRNEVRNFLVANALYWLDEFHADGLRVDAVASMLYLDYGKDPGGWVPNRFGGRENLDAIAFLRELNERVHARFPGAIVCAEESTAWPGVTRPTYLGGLGFDFKWNMGWMHDTLNYFSMDSIFRSFHHNLVTFGLMYAFSENFLLPLSHDEVVHLKRSLLSKMPGDVWRMRANLRALYGYMWAHPGKKLLFMGGEIGQWTEWNEATELQWGLLGEEAHRGIQRLVRDLNAAYRAHAALWEVDDSWEGFQWIDANDATQSVAAFVRYAKDAKPRPPAPPPADEEPPESKALRLALEADAATVRSPEDGGEEAAPEGEGTALSGEAISRSREGTAPSGEAISRSREGTALSGEAISPSREGIALSGEAISPSREGIALSGEAISPSREGIALSGEAISPSREGTALSGEAISRGGEGSARTAEAPATSAEAPSTAPEAGPPVARASAPAPRDPTVAGPHVVFVGNFTPVPRYNYRVGVPSPGRYRELLNTDAKEYGGSGMGNLGVVDVHPVPAHGFAQSIVLTLPPLSVLYLVPESAAGAFAVPALPSAAAAAE